MKRYRILIALILAIFCLGSIFAISHGDGMIRALLGAYLRMYGVLDRQFDVHGADVHLFENNKSDLETVVLLHGLGGDALYTWFNLLPDLAAAHHVIAIDLSYRRFQDIDAQSYSLEDELKNIIAVIDDEGISSAAVVGLSVGAWVGVQLAARYPERVERLVCIAPAGVDAKGLLDTAQVLRDVDARGFYDRLFFKPPPIPSFILNLHSANLRRTSEDLLACLERLAVSEQSILIDAQLVDIPVLIVWGREDRLLPVRQANVLARAFPDARVLLLADCGHAVVWDQAGALSKAVQAFLASAP